MPGKLKSKTGDKVGADAVDPVADLRVAEEGVPPDEEEIVEGEEVNILRKQPTDQFSSIWMKAQKLNTTQI